jgi:hypothetical protein
MGVLMVGRQFVVVSTTFSNFLLGVAINPEITFVNDGTSLMRDSGGSNVPGANWGNPAPLSGIGSSYWVKCELSSGTAAVTGTVGSWVALSTSPSWRINAPGAGAVSARNLTYQIATDALGASVVGSGTLELECDRS